MAFKLRKKKTFVHTCQLVQLDEAGKQHQAPLRVCFNAIPRAEWEEITNPDEDDDRLLFDVMVAGIEDDIEVEEGLLDKSQAMAAVRADLSLTNQIVEQGLKALFGATAKNAKRSRSR